MRISRDHKGTYSGDGDLALIESHLMPSGSTQIVQLISDCIINSFH